MNIKEIKWGLDQMWTRVTLMVKEGQNDVTLTTTITLVVDISAMAQWYTGYNGLYTGYRSLFLSYSKNRTYKLKIHSTRRQADILLLPLPQPMA